MLTEPQKKYIEQSWEEFWQTLTPEQQRILHFRLDDLMQYGQGALPLAYWHLVRLTEKEA